MFTRYIVFEKYNEATVTWLMAFSTIEVPSMDYENFDKKISQQTIIVLFSLFRVGISDNLKNIKKPNYWSLARLYI